MLEVWGRRNASNVMPVMWAIGELALPHRRHDVGGSFGGLDGPAYLALNPNGRIPDDSATTDRSSGSPTRSSATSVGATAGAACCPTASRTTAPPTNGWTGTRPPPIRPTSSCSGRSSGPSLRSRDRARIARLAASVASALGVLERHLAGRAFILGDRLTMADIPFGPMIHRYFALAVERPDLPHLRAWHERLCRRPAFREHVAFAFGSQPSEWYLLEQKGAAAAPQ